MTSLPRCLILYVLFVQVSKHQQVENKHKHELEACIPGIPQYSTNRGVSAKSHSGYMYLCCKQPLVAAKDYLV